MNFKHIQKLIIKSYLPTTEINRHVRLPINNPRNENDAEHSFSLALIGSILADKIGLNADRVALYATYHDLIEIYSGDTSLWDSVGYETKLKREKAAILRFKKEFKLFPIISKTIENYENLVDKEAKFTYALDKLIPLIINIQANGYFYHQNKITYEMHMKKVDEVRPKISQHQKVLKWYDEAVAYTSKNKKKLFYNTN